MTNDLISKAALLRELDHIRSEYDYDPPIALSRVYGIIAGAPAAVPDIKTNGDRIRAMTDEELVDVMKCPGPAAVMCYMQKSCKKYMLEWLSQEVPDER